MRRTGHIGADCCLRSLRRIPAVLTKQSDRRFGLEWRGNGRTGCNQGRIVADHVRDQVGIKLRSARSRQRRKPPALDPRQVAPDQVDVLDRCARADEVVGHRLFFREVEPGGWRAEQRRSAARDQEHHPVIGSGLRGERHYCLRRFPCCRIGHGVTRLDNFDAGDSICDPVTMPGHHAATHCAGKFGARDTGHLRGCLAAAEHERAPRRHAARQPSGQRRRRSCRSDRSEKVIGQGLAQYHRGEVRETGGFRQAAGNAQK